MIAFQVNDMTCGHCLKTITEAVKAVETEAVVRIDLANHRVEIDAAQVDARRWQQAIQDAGYTPVQLTTEAVPVTVEVKRNGCCCG